MTSSGTLPRMLPVFPLSGVVLLPGANLPLRVFEYRYLEMTADVIDSHRMIGIIQPRQVHRDPVPEDAPLFEVGCCGHLDEARELGDGTIAISLNGVCRFKMVEEIDLDTAYRTARVDYAPFTEDRGGVGPKGVRSVTDRKELMAAMEAYLESLGREYRHDGLKWTDDTTLTNVMTMSLPFDYREKQALLEAPSLAERWRMLNALMRIATAEHGGGHGDSLQ